MHDPKEKRKALVSVWDKDGVAELARALAAAGYGILSSSGTARHLKENGIDVQEVADLTGFPSILGGRVKTLHPAIMGGILARRDEPRDQEERRAFAIPRIDVVVCTLYPFEETARLGAGLDALIENIDIGGVSLIRAAAKNAQDVAVVTDKADYPRLIAALGQDGALPLELRRQLALKAFAVTSYYDAVVFEGLAAALGEEYRGLGETRVVALRKAQDLRYGENPHQKAALYVPGLATAPFVQLAGKALSYNNLLDLDTLLRGDRIFRDAAACVIVKHTTPCGAAVGLDIEEAYTRALACDPVSAFGGIVGLTRSVDLKTAQKLSQTFFEVIAAPAFTEEALKLLTAKPSLRLLQLTKNGSVTEQITGCRSGVLVQEDALPPPLDLGNARWVGPPREDRVPDLLLAWKTAWLTKSNAIVVAKDGAAVGIGGGFTNRIAAARHALAHAGPKAVGAVLASDAFFPFPDTVEAAHAAGIAAIVQPGGSVKDPEVEARALELGVSMLVGGPRTFRH